MPRDELPKRLISDGVTFDPDNLPEVLPRLHDVGQLQRVHRQPFSVYPQFLALAADVCASIKRRGDRFESDAELCSWLTEDGAHFDPDSLSAALHQLERLGRIKRPIVEHSWADVPLPGVYVEPRVYSEW